MARVVLAVLALSLTAALAPAAPAVVVPDRQVSFAADHLVVAVAGPGEVSVRHDSAAGDLVFEATTAVGPGCTQDGTDARCPVAGVSFVAVDLAAGVAGVEIRPHAAWRADPDPVPVPLHVATADQPVDVEGTDHDDVVALGSAAPEGLDGGAGRDRLDLSGVPGTAGASVDLAADTATMGGQAFSPVSMEDVTGTAGPDLLAGDASANRLAGTGGDDSILGRAGADDVSGGAGIDLLDFSDHTDPVTLTIDRTDFQRLHVATGDLYAGFEQARGGSGADEISVSPGQGALVEGGQGADALTIFNVPGSPAGAKLLGEQGDDFLTGGAGDDELLGGGGNDVVKGNAGDDLVDGGEDSDDRTGHGIVTLDGGAGDDEVRGGEGDDKLHGGTGTGADTLEGGPGSDRLDGGQGDDTLLGDGPTIPGGEGDDVLIGGDGADGIHGGPGRDRIDGGDGDDAIDAGAGDDFDPQPGFQAFVDGGRGDDEVAGGPGADELAGGEGDDTLLGGSERDLLQGGAGADQLDGGAGDDDLDGGAGPDGIEGGDGRDTVDYGDRAAGVTVSLGLGSGDDGNDLDGPAGQRDTVGAIEVLLGSQHADRLRGGAPGELIDGRGGDDTVIGGASADDLRGGSGRDAVSYEERSAPVKVQLGNVNQPGADGDVISGFEDATGGSGADVLIGDGGPNVLTGGPGSDTLMGGEGADTYAAGSGDDDVRALDEVAESVSCGSGIDDLQADDTDALSECEVRRITEVDADDDGAGHTADCDDANPRRSPLLPEVGGNDVDENCDGVKAPAPVVDADADGWGPPKDCNDSDRAVSPSAREVRGNGVDEDCDGVAAPLLRPATVVTLEMRKGRVAHLRLRRVPAAATVVVTCRPAPRRGACPFTSATRSFPAAQRVVDLASLFKRRVLPLGARVRVLVTAPESVGRLAAFRITEKGADGALPRCLLPGGQATAC